MPKHSKKRKSRSRSLDTHQIKGRNDKERKSSRSRRESPARSSRRKDEKKVVKKEFSFEDYREDLDCLFFTHRDLIKKGSDEYEEFWKFYAKYTAVREKQVINFD